MTNLQLKMEVQGAAQNWVASIMQQYGVSAVIMEDALTKVLLNLKDLVTQETIREILTAQTSNEIETEEKEEKEEEIDKDGTE